jgi:hypothetical protein
LRKRWENINEDIDLEIQETEWESGSIRSLNHGATEVLDDAHEALSRLYTKTSKRSKAPSRYPKRGEAWQ